MSIFTRFAGQDIRARAQTLWSSASGLVIPEWAQRTAVSFSGGAASGIATLASPAFPGFTGAAQSSGNAAWLLPATGPLQRVLPAASAAVVTSFAASPSGLTLFTALAQIANQPLLTDASGVIYTQASSATAVSGSFGQLANALGSSGAALIGLLPASNNIAAFLASGSGTVAVPMQQVQCMATSGGAVAVGGYNQAAFVSGFAAMAVNPADATYLAGATPAAGAISLWHNSGNDSWTDVQAITGVGQGVGMAWAENGNVIIAAVRASQVRVLSYAFGAISLTQSIPVSAATAVAITLDSANALVCQPLLNTVTPLTFAGSAWTSGVAIPIGNPQAVVALDTVNIAIGGASGITIATISGGIWTLGTTTAIGFVPNAMTLDNAGNIYAVGNSGGFGCVYSQGVSATFVGQASGVVWQSGQVVVGDHTGALQIFEFFQNAWTLQSTASAVAVTAMALAGDTVFASSSTSTQQFKLSAPWTVQSQASGAVAVYSGGAWATTLLAVNQIPNAMTFDPSGNVSVATSDNHYLTVAVTGGVVASAVIAQDTGQAQTVPIGISSLRWINAKLYGTSTLNEAVVEIV